jgi:hypothetical protein
LTTLPVTRGHVRRSNIAAMCSNHRVADDLPDSIIKAVVSALVYGRPVLTKFPVRHPTSLSIRELRPAGH